jgi:hypothetical protein
MKKLLVNFATRSRPTKFFNCLDNLRNLSATNNLTILVKADLDDPDMCQDWVKALAKTYDNVIMDYGYSGSKIAAINRGVKEYQGEWDILLNHSDDMVFLETGFDEIICNDYKKYFPNLKGALHYPDSFAKGRVITYSILGRPLYDMLGNVYNNEYDSVYPDNEFTEVVRMLGMYKFIDRPILEHLHPISKKAAWDNLYKKNESPEMYKKDRETYNRRKANNFGL